MPMGGAAIGAGAGILGGVIGNIASAGDRDAATQAKLNALQNLQNISVPTIAEQEWNLQNYKSAGNLNPLLEGTVNQQDTSLNNIKTDPRLAQAQMQALSSLQQQGATGLSPSDKLALIQTQNGINQQDKARQASILQNMAASGNAGGGAQLAAQLASAQQASQNANTGSMGTLAQAQNNALNAIASGGNLAGQMQNTSFNQQAQVGSAQDAINRLNSINRQNVMGTNTNTQNQAQQYNLGNAQNISNANTGNANQQNEHNTGLYQQQFQDTLNKNQAAAGQANSYGNQLQQNAANTAGMWTGIGNSIGGAAGGMGQSGGKKSANAGDDNSAANFEDEGAMFGAYQ